MTPAGLRGFLESPGRFTPAGEAVRVSGWVFGDGAPVRELFLVEGGHAPRPVLYGLSRPDVARAYPDVREAASCGFSATLLPNGDRGLVLRLEAVLEDGRRVPWLSRRVRVGEPLARRIVAFARGWSRRSSPPEDPYQGFLRTNRLTPRLLAELGSAAETLATTGPLVSVVVPVYETREDHLAEMLASVGRQIYRRWELCLADDASSAPHVRRILREAAAADPRVKVVIRRERGHVAAATGSALELATGELVAFLDHDDLLSEDALLHVAEHAAAHPEAEWLFTDEDKVDESGRRFDPFLKGAFSPEMALTHNGTHHLTVVRRGLLDRAGGVRPGFDGAQDLDLFLRLAEVTPAEHVQHVPFVCYHWRSHGGSTAARGSQKRYVFESARRAITGMLERRGLRATPFLPEVAERHALCLHQLRWDPALLRERPATIVIPTRDSPERLARCVTSLERTVDPRGACLLVVDDDSRLGQTRDLLCRLERERPLGCRVVTIPREGRGFSYARLLNQAAKLVETPLFLQLNDDVEALSPGWLEDMAGWMSVPGVGAVGAKLLYPDGSLQHAGVVIGPHGGLADHAFHRLPAEAVGYTALPHAARNVSAVTGACLLTETALFRELSGFDETRFPVQYNDVDFCLRLREAGRRVVFTPNAQLRHVGAASRGALPHDVREHAAFRERWRTYREPFVSDALDLESPGMPVAPARFVHARRLEGRSLSVLFLTHNLALEGAPLIVLDYARALVAAGFRLEVVSPEDGPLRRRYEEIGVPVRLLGDGQRPETGDRLGVSGFDLIVANTLPMAWGVELARSAARPSIWHIHDRPPGGVVAPATARALASATRVVFQAEATRRLFAAHDRDGRFRTIPGAVDLAALRARRQAAEPLAASRARHGIPLDRPLLVSLGTVCERKAQHVLVEAVARLAAERPATCLLVGLKEAPYLAGYVRALRERIADLGLEGVVRLVPETESALDLLALADVAVSSSFEESFPRSLLEAMALGLPIVATRVDGVPEMIADGEEGLLVPPGDPVSLASALGRLLAGPEQAAGLGLAAAAKAARCHDDADQLPRQVELAREAVLAFTP